MSQKKVEIRFWINEEVVKKIEQETKKTKNKAVKHYLISKAIKDKTITGTDLL